MLVVMAITLYTSRVVLNTLGVEDFGIQNVVGGFVSMFSLISGSMQTTISRFLTFEIGHGDSKRLIRIFSSSVNIQVAISLLVIILAETIGLWFLNYKMNIPEDRWMAANWVFQFSLATFFFSLVSAPFSSSLIAHERMSAYAYISIIDVCLKLGIVYIVIISQWDKLIFYSALLMLVSLSTCILYIIYCSIKFSECRYRFIFDKAILKEMGGFAGWNYMGSIAYVLRGQGINVLMNLFFGVAVNAARGITSQVESAVAQFSSSFIMAINPQITKSYARDDRVYLHKLICKGAKYSYYLMMLIVIPLLFETPIILSIWLKNVPEYTVLFTRLTLIVALFDVFSTPITTAILATGEIKKLQIQLSGIMIAIFPVSYILYLGGLPAYTCYIVCGLAVIARLVVELPIIHRLIGMPIKMFITEVIIKSLFVTVLSLIVPISIILLMDESILRLVCLVLLSSIFTMISMYLVGLTPKERNIIVDKIKGVKCFESYK